MAVGWIFMERRRASHHGGFDDRLGDEVAVDFRARLEHGETAAIFIELGGEREDMPGTDGLAEARFFDARESGALACGLFGKGKENQDAADLRQSFDLQHAGHYGFAGK